MSEGIRLTPNRSHLIPSDFTRQRIFYVGSLTHNFLVDHLTKCGVIDAVLWYEGQYQQIAALPGWARKLVSRHGGTLATLAELRELAYPRPGLTIVQQDLFDNQIR